MANPGFNIKVRQVVNGYTIHFTNLSYVEDHPNVIEAHEDHIAATPEDVVSLVNKLTYEGLEDDEYRTD